MEVSYLTCPAAKACLVLVLLCFNVQVDLLMINCALSPVIPMVQVTMVGRIARR